MGDEIARWPFLFGSRDAGLRGGTVRISGGRGAGVTFALHGVRWVADATVDGTAHWIRGPRNRDPRLVVHGPSGPATRIVARWGPFEKLGLATINGRAGTARLRATFPAP